MTRSQDFDAMSAHYGYGPVCAVLSQRFGATFEFTTTGGNCTALVATLEGGYRVLITDGGDMIGSLTPLSQRDGSEGFVIGVYPLDADGCWGGDEPPVWVDDPAAVVGALPDLVLCPPDGHSRMNQFTLVLQHEAFGLS
jgi:hypothetical protein